MFNMLPVSIEDNPEEVVAKCVQDEAPEVIYLDLRGSKSYQNKLVAWNQGYKRESDRIASYHSPILAAIAQRFGNRTSNALKKSYWALVSMEEMPENLQQAKAEKLIEVRLAQMSLATYITIDELDKFAPSPEEIASAGATEVHPKLKTLATMLSSLTDDEDAEPT